MGNPDAFLGDARWPFQVAEQFFCIYFLFELVVRFSAFYHKVDCLKDGWFKFDSFLVIQGVVDTWIMQVWVLIIGGSGQALPTAPLKLLRLLRLARVSRMLKAVPELLTLVKGICV